MGKKKKKKPEEELEVEDLESEDEETAEDIDEEIAELTPNTASELLENLYPDAVQLLIRNTAGEFDYDPQMMQHDIVCSQTIIQSYWIKRLCAAIVNLTKEIREGRISGE